MEDTLADHKKRCVLTPRPREVAGSIKHTQRIVATKGTIILCITVWETNQQRLISETISVFCFAQGLFFFFFAVNQSVVTYSIVPVYGFIDMCSTG